MIGVLQYFDGYTVRARIVPALIAGLPSLAFLFVSVPWDSFGLSNAIVLTMGFILLYAFADLARSRGKKVEAKLDTRQSPELWHRADRQIPQISKDIYRTFIASVLNHPAPSEHDERTDPARADDFYLSAGNWLRDATRDRRKFKILYDELLTYGFRRNLLGLKPVALAMNALVAAALAALFYVRPSYFYDINHADVKFYVLVTATLCHSFYMIFAVGKTGVKEASATYGRQLILSCELLMPAQRLTPTNDRAL